MISQIICAKMYVLRHIQNDNAKAGLMVRAPLAINPKCSTKPNQCLHWLP